jgi:hydrogenase nickel incorporation protein HypA/HybF
LPTSDDSPITVTNSKAVITRDLPTRGQSHNRNTFNVHQNVEAMHELSMATSVMDIILKKAREEYATKISEINIEIGELLFLNPEQFQFCMELVIERTIAEKAALNITVKQSKLKCKACGKEFRWDLQPDDHLVFPVLQCECGSRDLAIVEGRELNIVSIRIEKPD